MAPGTLSFGNIRPEDITPLTALLTAAFDDSAHRNSRRPRGGPPGYDTGELLTRWAVGNPDAWWVLEDGVTIGLVVIQVAEDRTHTLVCLAVDPDRQREGYGGTIWDAVYGKHADAVAWTARTPESATSDHAFLEKRCGFELLRTEPEGDQGPTRVYVRSGPAVARG